MKKLFLVLLVAIFAIGCNEPKEKEEAVRYTQDSEEINTLKAAIKDYENGNWDAMKKHYADTAQIYHNGSGAMSIDTVIKNQRQGVEDFSSYGFVPEENDYEMVLTDDGHTWVNYWGDWTATFAGTDKKITVPVHLTARFENGKIVREHGYWDNSIGMMAAQSLDTIQENQE